MVLVKTFYAYNELRNFSYLILDDATGNSWVIDPYEPHLILNYILKKSLTLKGILNTHKHYDHIRGNNLLSSLCGCSVLYLGETEKIQINSTHELKVFNTPGHTLDHQVFLLFDKNKSIAIFSGDTLFNSGVGNCKDGGNVELLFQSTVSLMTLPLDILIYPGHDYRKRNLEFAQIIEPNNKKILERINDIDGLSTETLEPTTLREELEVNPFLRLESSELRQNLMKKFESLNRNMENNRYFFKILRKLRDEW
jgi:hydroxyacylglutathione hydrolase